MGPLRARLLVSLARSEHMARFLEWNCIPKRRLPSAFALLIDQRAKGRKVNGQEFARVNDL